MSENNILHQKIDSMAKLGEDNERRIERLIQEKEVLQKSTSSFEKEVEELKKMITAVRQNSRQSLIKLEEKTTKESEMIRQLNATIVQKDEQLRAIELQLEGSRETRSVDSTTELFGRIENLECEKLRLMDNLSQLNQEKSALLLENEKLKMSAVGHKDGVPLQDVPTRQGVLFIW
jgi:hypothetical protein